MKSCKKSFKKIEEGDVFKILGIEKNPLSELEEEKIIDVFKTTDVKKTILPRTSGRKKKEIIAIQKDSTKFKFLLKDRGVVIYNETPNGVNIHGVVTKIKKI